MRCANRIPLLLLVALLLLVTPAAASAQASYSSSGGQSSGSASGGAGAAQYYDDTDDGGASADDPYYDHSYDENTDNGGQEPSGSLPDPPKAPAKPKAPPAPAPAPPTPPAPTTPAVTSPGTVAQMMSNGKATVPRNAPKAVRQMIVAANRLIGKPYLWGGGHAKLEDKGYDCSGSVSYALIAGGQLTSPLVSGALAKWGAVGAGAWVTVYANKDHAYMEIAGLRFDTSPVADPSGAKGPRWRPAIGGRKGFKVRHSVGL